MFHCELLPFWNTAGAAASKPDRFFIVTFISHFISSVNVSVAALIIQHAKNVQTVPEAYIEAAKHKIAWDRKESSVKWHFV